MDRIEFVDVVDKFKRNDPPRLFLQTMKGWFRMRIQVGKEELIALKEEIEDILSYTDFIDDNPPMKINRLKLQKKN